MGDPTKTRLFAAIYKPARSRGLFGKYLSEKSNILINEPPLYGMEFKGTKLEYVFNIYHYREDIEYKAHMRSMENTLRGSRNSTLIFQELKRRRLTLLPWFLTTQEAINISGVEVTPVPPSNMDNGYIYPSYIIWDNDPSLYNFLGEPEGMEFPKRVLEQTSGYPQKTRTEIAPYQLRTHPKWRI